MYHRGAPRSGGKNNEQLKKTEERRIPPHNPFQQQRRRITSMKRRRDGVAPIIILACVLPCLIGLVLFVRWNDRANVNSNIATAVVFPRSFQVGNEDGFFPLYSLERNTRMHPREARKQLEKIMNQQTMIVSRRRIITPIITKQEDAFFMDEVTMQLETIDESSSDSSSDSDDSSSSSSSSKDNKNMVELHHDVNCEYQDWQKKNPVACNNIHEVDNLPNQDSFVILGCGGDRCAFQITDFDNGKIVLKMPK